MSRQFIVVFSVSIHLQTALQFCVSLKLLFLGYYGFSHTLCVHELVIQEKGTQNGTVNTSLLPLEPTTSTFACLDGFLVFSNNFKH